MGPKPKLGFIGAGRVGNALARCLAAAGYDIVAVANRTSSAAETLAAAVPGCSVLPTPQAVAYRCDLVFITTPDDAIETVVDSIAWRPGSAVVHTSGAKSTDILSAAKAQGAETGSLHPLQTFADAEQALANLPGSVFAVEAEEGLRQQLLAIVADLGGVAIELRPEEKALYHAAAVLVSNYTVTLMKLATDLWLRFGWERPAAVKALLPLLRGTVSNIAALGLPAALTGPVARGDVETIERHLAALAEAAPDVLPAYKELALLTLPVALAKGTLSDDDAASLRALLGRDLFPAGSGGAKRTS